MRSSRAITWSAICTKNEEARRPHRRKADAPPPEPANDRPWEQAPDWTPKEKFWAVMGVLKATLAIAGVYLVGLGVLLAVLFLLWK